MGNNTPYKINMDGDHTSRSPLLDTRLVCRHLQQSAPINLTGTASQQSPAESSQQQQQQQPLLTLNHHQQSHHQQPNNPQGQQSSSQQVLVDEYDLKVSCLLQMSTLVTSITKNIIRDQLRKNKQ